MKKKKKRFRRKLNFKRIFMVLGLFLSICFFIYFLLNIRIKNICIMNNHILSDREVISLANLNNYPSFLKLNPYKIRKNIEQNVYVKKASIKRNLLGKINIDITEKKILGEQDNLLLLEDGNFVSNEHNILGYPIIVSDISLIKDKFISSFALVDANILKKISEIEYTPNDVDNERFKLRMNDGNLVYITLNKIEKINMYNGIYTSLDGKKGIIYLDSGDYVEVK